MITLTAMTIDINLPAIPGTAEALGSSLTEAQFTVTIFFGGFAFGQLLWGSLSDRFGRKPGIMIGTVIYLIATVGCALAPSIEALLAWRAIEGIGAGAGSVLGRAIIRDLFTGPQMARILSLVMAAFIIAPDRGALDRGRHPDLRLLALDLRLSGRLRRHRAAAGGAVPRGEPQGQGSARSRTRPGWLRSFAAVFHDPRSRSWAAVVTLIGGALTGLPHQFLGRADGRLWPEPHRVRHRVRRRRCLLLGGQPAEFAAGAPNAAGAARRAGACRCRGDVTGGSGPGAERRRAACGGWSVPRGCSSPASGRSRRTGPLWPWSRTARPRARPRRRWVSCQTVVPAVIASGVAALYDGTAVPMFASMLAMSTLGALIAVRRRPA